MAGFRGFWVCWESFVPVGFGGGCCRESFVPVGPGAAVAGRVLYRVLARAPGGARCRGRAGRGLYRSGWWCPCDGCGVVLLREKILPARWRSVGNGKKFSLLAGNGRISVFLGVLGEFCTGWARAWGSLGAGLLCGAPLARKLADDGLLFGHADDAGALAQGQGRGHGHGAGAAREHEENQHVFGAHGQDWGDAGGQADGREC